MTVGEVGSTNSPGLHRQAHRQVDAGISRWCRAKFRWNFLNTNGHAGLCVIRPRLAPAPSALEDRSVLNPLIRTGECQKLGELPNQTRECEPI